jgi:hypothetical protein
MPTRRSKHNNSSNTEHKAPYKLAIQACLCTSVKRAMVETALSAVDDDNLSMNHDGTDTDELVAFFKNEFPRKYPPPKSLTKKCWTGPKNRMHLMLSQDVQDILANWFIQGQGVENKFLRKTFGRQPSRLVQNYKTEHACNDGINASLLQALA